MTKLEKVIKGLECCTTIGEDGFSICDECPYFENGSCPNFDEMHTDALELLKAQMPKVMTWEEVEHAEVCWLEVYGWEPYAALDASEWNPEEYGKSYRCWSAKPTKEQMKAVKWDDEA